MHLFKADLLDKSNGLLKIGIRFSGKAGDDICCDDSLRELLTNLQTKICIFRTCVMAVHALENGIAAALQGQVELRTEFVAIGKTAQLQTCHAVRLE